MTRRIFLWAFVAIAATFTVEAAPTGQPARPLAVARMGTKHELPAVVRTAMTNFVQDPLQDPCGPIDPDRPCYSDSGGLVITSCEANGYAMCSKCEDQYTWNGTLIGSVCKQVKESADCKCSKGNREGCTTQGQCTYNGWLWH